MKKYLFLVLLFIIPVENGWGQDPQFSQFYSSPLFLGPSFSGSSGGSRMIMNYRDQWSKLPGSFVTYAFSFDHFIDEYNSGLGLLISRDEAGGGLYNSTNIGLQYSYNFNINRYWQIRPGIHSYYYQRKINFNSLLFPDQISWDLIYPTSTELPRTEKIGHVDFAGSVLAYSKNYWFGLTVDHFMTVNPSLKEKENYLPMKFSVYGGGKYMLYGRTRLVKEKSVSFAFHFYSQDRNNKLDFGSYLIKAPLLFGLWYRGVPIFIKSPNIGALTLLFGYKIEKLSIGYSYDVTMSRLIAKTGNAHEVSLIYEFGDISLKKKKGAVPCPRILF